MKIERLLEEWEKEGRMIYQAIEQNPSKEREEAYIKEYLGCMIAIHQDTYLRNYAIGFLKGREKRK